MYMKMSLVWSQSAISVVSGIDIYVIIIWLFITYTMKKVVYYIRIYVSEKFLFWIFLYLIFYIDVSHLLIIPKHAVTLVRTPG